MGRHLSGIVRLAESFNYESDGDAIAVTNVPILADLQTAGIDAYLHGPNGEAPLAQGTGASW